MSGPEGSQGAGVLVIVAVAALILLAGVGVVAWQLMSDANEPHSPPAATTPPEVVSSVPSATVSGPPAPPLTAMASASAAPSASASRIEGPGTLPTDSIQRVVRAGFEGIKACYEEGMGRKPRLGGRLMVRFVITEIGDVTELGTSGDFDDEIVIACVTSEFKKLTFPPPQGGRMTVSYPITFSP